MKGLIQFFLLVILVTFISRANAGLLIEPVVGYNLGASIDTDIDGVGEVDGGTGVSYGGRLGYTNLGLQLGVDYLKSTLSMDDDFVDEDVNFTEMAAFVGFKFPVLLRVYAGYIFSSNADTEVAGSKIEYSEGSGTKVGIGFTGLPFVNINVEYRSGKFDTLESGGVEVDSSATYKSLMLSASVPFDI
jgi:hypothetical protein